MQIIIKITIIVTLLIRILLGIVNKSMFAFNGLHIMLKNGKQFSQDEISRIVEMAWEDRTPFEAIELNFGVNESAVIKLMRSQMKSRSFRLWRQRVSSRKTKHLALRSPEINRGYCPTQYKQR
jgi:uncharacterized protein (TIGR03643 family)